MESEGQTSLSTYLPTARGGEETLQGPTGLKNLLREAHQWLHKAGIDTRTTKDCSDPPNRCGKTMSEIAGENNTTTFLPLPIELFTPFLNRASDDSGKKV